MANVKNNGNTSRLGAVMKINFIDLNNIDERLYKKCIHKIFATWSYRRDSEIRRQFNLWTVNIYPVRHKLDNPNWWSNYEEKTNSFIPHGNTGMYEINLFIQDFKNSMVMLQNMRMASHEIAHAVMMTYYGFSNQEMTVKKVHELHNNFHTKLIKFLYFNRSTFWFRRITLSILNIEDYVNTRKNNKGFSPYYK